MTDEQRNSMIDDQLDLMIAVCNSFAEVDEEDNCRAIYEEYAEWIEGGSDLEVLWWVSPFKASN